MAMRYFLGGVTIAVAIFAISSVAMAAAPDVGDPAPALMVPELDGHGFDLAALRGKIVIINFWATWCGPCRQEMPRLNAFEQKYRDRGVFLLGVSADQARDRDEVRKVMKSFSYPAAMLNDATTNGFGRPTELPITYVIGPDGVVRDKLLPTDGSGISEQTLESAVTPLLHGMPSLSTIPRLQ